MTNRYKVHPFITFLNSGIFSFRRFAFLLLLLLPFQSFAQVPDEDEEFIDEITVTLDVRGMGTVEIPAVYRDKEAYLSITSLFDYIKIRNISYSGADSIIGFFITEQNVYLIDKPNNRIVYKDKEYKLHDDGLISTENGLFLNLKYFKTVFGLDGTFYFRRLVVTISSDEELPAVKEARQEQMRKNISKLKGELKADTTIARNSPFFHFGMADWAVMSSQQSQSGDQTTVNLGLGAVLAGGELNASLNYYSQQAFTERLQYYQWRFVNNDRRVVKQLAAGKIFTQSTATLYAPVVGVQITNASTLYRHSYGSYTLSNSTEPGWIVELYVNEVLVDYKKADASGFYSFDVPLIYGYTVVKLKFYGPYGEVRTSQQYVNIPFNFLPSHAFEYSINGGIVEDRKDSKFARLSMKYGLSPHVTIGGGSEYLTSVSSGHTMPFLNTSIRMAPRMLLSGEYTHGVRAKAILSHRLQSGLQYELDYTKFSKGQTAIFFNYLEERKVVLSLPFKVRKVSLFSRLTVDQIIVPNVKYTNTELAFTGFAGRVGINMSTFASFLPTGVPYFYSVASVSLPLPSQITFTTQVQYDFKANRPVFSKLMFERRFFSRGTVSFAYQEYFNAKNRNFLLGMRYEFDFARVAVSSLAGSNNTYNLVEAASGSLIFDHKSGYANANNRTNVGKGAIAIRPFLDNNYNGVRDEGEPMVPGLKVKINGGRISDDKDTTIRILDLQPYNTYYIELNRNSFDNIAWQLKSESMNVTVNPNNFTLIEMPVTVVGEVSGMVLSGSNDGNGQGQIIVAIFDKDDKLVARTVSESDGYFSYLGLKPGTYTVKMDSAQMAKLSYKVAPASVSITIKGIKEGDVVDGLEFTLTSDKK